MSSKDWDWKPGVKYGSDDTVFVWCFSYTLRGGAGGLRYSDPYTEDTIDQAVADFRTKHSNELAYIKIERLYRSYYNVVGTTAI